MTTNNKKIELHIHIKGAESLGDIFNIDMRPSLSTNLVEGDVQIKSNEVQEKNFNSSNDKNNEDLDTLFTVAEFASYFKVSQITARSWLKKGLIPYLKIGKRFRIRKSKILELEKIRGE